MMQKDAVMRVGPKHFEKNLIDSYLNGVASLLGDALERDNDLELWAEYVSRIHIVERRVFIDFVCDGHWPKDQNAIVFAVHLGGDIHVRQLVGYCFALVSDLLLDDDHANVSLQQGWLAQIAQSTNEVEATISHGDYGVFAEHNCLTPFARNSEFGENDAGHARLNDDSDDALRWHHNDGERTLFVGGSEKSINLLRCTSSTWKKVFRKNRTISVPHMTLRHVFALQQWLDCF